MHRASTLLLFAALSIHCDKSGGGTSTPDPPDPLPGNASAHPDVDKLLPELLPEIDAKTQALLGREATKKILWLGTESSWERRRNQLTGIILGRSFHGVGIVLDPDDDEDDYCRAVRFEVWQELLEYGGFAPPKVSVELYGAGYTSIITCRSAAQATVGLRPGQAGPAGDAAAPEGGGAPGDVGSPATPSGATPAADRPALASAPIASGPAVAAADRAGFEQVFTLMNTAMKGFLPKIEEAEKDYKEWSAGLSDAAKKSSAYADMAKQHDEVAKQAKKVKADHAAWTTFYESHKQTPSAQDSMKLSTDGQTLMQATGKVLTDYTMMSNKRGLVGN